MLHKLSRLVPPGSDVTRELSWYGGMLLLLAGISLRFPIRFLACRDGLYYERLGRRFLYEGARMESINVLLRHSFTGLWVLLLFCIAMTAAHYLEFHRGSKSIYVMRRLSNRRELIKRCAALPAMVFPVGILLSAMLLGLYSLIYYHMTPAGCLPAPEAIDLWRAIL